MLNSFGRSYSEVKGKVNVGLDLVRSDLAQAASFQIAVFAISVPQRR